MAFLFGKGLSHERLMEILEDPNFLRPMLRAGHKIEAVRHYSETTRVSLEKAQEVVDQLEEQMRRGQ